MSDETPEVEVEVAGLTPGAVPAAAAPTAAAAQGSIYNPVQPIEVDTPSGQKLRVMGAVEEAFYNQQAQRYQDENKFTNTSDLLDLDRLVFLELLVYRTATWLASGRDYDGMEIDEKESRRNLKEVSELIAKVKNDLGMTKSQRDKAQHESVGTYITELKQRAKEFGIHREKQLIKGITLMKQLFSIIGAYDRADEVERQKLGFESEEDILNWIREVMRPEFDAVDEYFRSNAQRYWVRQI